MTWVSRSKRRIRAGFRTDCCKRFQHRGCLRHPRIRRYRSCRRCRRRLRRPSHRRLRRPILPLRPCLPCSCRQPRRLDRSRCLRSQRLRRYPWIHRCPSSHRNRPFRPSKHCRPRLHRLRVRILRPARLCLRLPRTAKNLACSPAPRRRQKPRPVRKRAPNPLAPSSRNASAGNQVPAAHAHK
jgi:hypothetical protein